eukprot:1743849-Pyramimonas_sp.AAC.1
MGCGASSAEIPALPSPALPNPDLPPSPALPAPPAIVASQSDDVHNETLASPAQPAVSFEPPKPNEVVKPLYIVLRAENAAPPAVLARNSEIYSRKKRKRE